MQRISDAGRSARQILELARRTLSRTIPALMPAFYALREQAVELPEPLATDSVHLFYCPERVTADFRADRRAVARQLLHLTLHCLLGHPAQRRNICNQRRFDLAVDLKVLADPRKYSFHPQVRIHGNGEVKGNESICPGRQDPQYRSRGSTHGNDAPGDRRGDRRRHSERQEIQGSPDRRSVRRLYPCGASGCAD